jgi:hypothetical protein
MNTGEDSGGKRGAYSPSKNNKSCADNPPFVAPVVAGGCSCGCGCEGGIAGADRAPDAGAPGAGGRGGGSAKADKALVAPFPAALGSCGRGSGSAPIELLSWPLAMLFEPSSQESSPNRSTSFCPCPCPCIRCCPKEGSGNGGGGSAGGTGDLGAGHLPVRRAAVSTRLWLFVRPCSVAVFVGVCVCVFDLAGRRERGDFDRGRGGEGVRRGEETKSSKSSNAEVDERYFDLVGLEGDLYGVVGRRDLLGVRRDGDGEDVFTDVNEDEVVGPWKSEKSSSSNVVEYRKVDADGGGAIGTGVWERDVDAEARGGGGGKVMRVLCDAK